MRTILRRPERGRGPATVRKREVIEPNDVGALAELKRYKPLDEHAPVDVIPDDAVVVNPRPPHPFKSIAAPAAVVGAALAGVFVLGALLRVWMGTYEPPETVVFGALIIWVVAAWLWHSRPTEVRLEADGIRIRSWSEAARDSWGELVPLTEEPGFVLGPSGTFVASTQRKPVRIVVNASELEAAAGEQGIRFDRLRTWWIWKALFWAGVIGLLLVPWVGILLLIAAYAVRVMSHW
jgi:hypothetical protein